MNIVDKTVSVVTGESDFIGADERDFFVNQAKALAAYALDNLAGDRLTAALKLSAAIAEYGWATVQK